MKNIYILLIALFAFSCVDNDFDDSKGITFPEPKTPNYTLAQYKTTFLNKECKEDATIVGTVISSDEGSNFYKEIFIKDASGILRVSVDQYSSFRRFPVNSQLEINIKGTRYIGQYSALGISSKYGNSRIPPVLYNVYLQRCVAKEVKPLETTIPYTGSAPQEYELVKVTNGFWFEKGGKETFSYTQKERDADQSNKREKINVMVDKNGNKLNVPISSYSPFSQEVLPTDTFEVVGLMSDPSSYTIKIRTQQDLIKIK